MGTLIALLASLATFLSLHRADNGLAPMDRKPVLDIYASGRCAQQAITGRLDHSGVLTGIGENLAAGFPTADAVFQAWRNSPGHNANMLGPYGAYGIAVCYGPAPYGLFWVTVFVRPGPSPLIPQAWVTIAEDR